MQDYLTQKSKQSHDSGKFGEKVARNFLENKNYKILEQNYRASYCEIDLIAQKDDYIIFVEVKARSGDLSTLPREFVTKAKQKNLIKAAKYYLYKNNIDAFCRFDIIEIYLDTKKIVHLKDAFS